MPTPLPSSFASAAAGNTQDPSRRGDGGAGGEWYAILPSLPYLDHFMRPFIFSDALHNPLRLQFHESEISVANLETLPGLGLA